MNSIYLVDGCPGSGKTRYLSLQCERAVQKHGTSGVAIASLTRTAATEIAGRVDLADGLVGTLHAHAYRGLDRPELAETPEGIREWNQAHPHLALTSGKVLEDAPIDTDNDGRGHADQLHAQVMNRRARITPITEWTPEQAEYHSIWTDFKANTGRIDFTDLIERAISELPEHPEHPQVMLFDEAQDFSALELRLALRWAERTDTTIIAGDLDQAIYGFRGADPDAFDRIQFTERRSLDQSYRCPAAVRDLARGWMAGNGMPTAPWKARVGDDLDVGVRGTMRGHVDSLPITLRTTDQLLEHLAADLADGRTPMVLATCGYMLAPLIHQLRAASVPFHNPHRAAQGSWNPMVGANRLLAYLRHDPAIWGTDARTWTWDDLRLWTEPLAAKNVLPRGTKSLIEAKCRKDEFGRTQASQPVDLETVCRLLDTADTRSHPAFHGDIDWWAANLRGSQTRPNAYAVDLYRRNGPEPLAQWAQTIADPDAHKRTDLPWVTVGTGHSVKGAEASRVYIFPDLSKQGMWNGWHGGGAGRAQIVRLFYVMASRARERVTVLQPSTPEHVPLEHLDGSSPAPASEQWATLEQRLADAVSIPAETGAA